MIAAALRWLKGHLIYVVVGSLAAGLLTGQFIGPGTQSRLQAAIVPILFVMIYPMMINIDLQEMLAVRDHAAPVVASLVVNFGVAPLVAVGLARLFFGGDPAYAIGLYLIALIPTSGMTAAWTGLAGGDLEAALVAIAVNLVVAVFVLPAYLSVLVGADVGFDPSALYRQLAIIVAIPMVAGNGTRRLLVRQYGPEQFKRFKPTFGGISSFGVMLIVFVAMAIRSEHILADPIASGATIVPLVLFYAAIVAVASGVGRLLLSNTQSVALVYATSMRNLSIALAIAAAPGFPPAESVLPIALAYLVQPPLGALYMSYRRDVVEEGRSVADVVRAWIPGS